MGTNEEDGEDHEESCKKYTAKDAPPPDHHLLLPSEKGPEKEQEREFDADIGSSK